MFVLIAALLLQSTDVAGAPGEIPGPAAPVATTPEDLATIAEAINAGRLEEAATLITVARARPEAEADPELALLEGELEVARDNIALAEKRVADVADSARLHCRLQRIRGLALAGRNETDAAIDRLGEVTERCAADWRVWTSLGTLLADRREEAGSRYAFAQALAREERNMRIRRELARAMLRLGRVEDAAETLSEARSLAPQDEEIQRLADYVAGMLGQEPVRAVDETEERWALRLADTAQGARSGQHEALARRLFDRALLLSPRYDPRLLAEVARP